MNNKRNFNNNGKITEEIKSLIKRRDIIVKKSIDGVLSDTVVKEEIEQITLQISKLELEKDVKVKPIEYQKVLHKAMQILKNPCEIMKSSSISEIRRFLKLAFPSGVIYENGDYRTQEMCSIFKLKTLIEGINSSRVPHLDGKNKLPNLVSFENEIEKIFQKATMEIELYETFVIDRIN